MRSNRRPTDTGRATLPILIITLLTMLTSVVLAGCGNGSEPTAAETAAHNAKKKDPKK